MPDYLDEPLCHLAVRVLLFAIADVRRGRKSARRFLQTTGADWAGALGIDREAWLAAVASLKRVKAKSGGRQPSLTPEQIKEIHERHARGDMSMRQLATLYGVRPGTVQYHLQKYREFDAENGYNVA